MLVYTLQVNLVLEYCDWGCLRDALDAGAFFSGGSLNYAAILDTAADVAKAMLHLHCNQVWTSGINSANAPGREPQSLSACTMRGACVAVGRDYGASSRRCQPIGFAQADSLPGHEGSTSRCSWHAAHSGHPSRPACITTDSLLL